MSRPSYLRGRQEVPIPEPPSLAARRRNSNATTLQLQSTAAIADPKARAYGAIYQTPSPKQTFAAGKNSDYFRTSHTSSGSPTLSTISPTIGLAHQRNRSSLYGQPPTPSITQHVPAWNMHEEPRSRGGSITSSDMSGDNDDPLHILDTLPIHKLRLNANAPVSDSRCGTLKRPLTVTEERRSTTWPAGANLDASTSGIANRRLASTTNGTAPVAPRLEQSRPITAKLRAVEPVPNTTRLAELGKQSRSPSQLNRPQAADCAI